MCSMCSMARLWAGAFLLTAAGLKSQSAVIIMQTADSRVFEIGLILAESFLALWLLSGIAPCRCRTVALIAFGAFAIVSGVKALQGESTCGCFGAASVSPVVTLVLDLATMFLLTIAGSDRERSAAGRFTSRLVYVPFCGGVAVCTLLIVPQLLVVRGHDTCSIVRVGGRTIVEPQPGCPLHLVAYLECEADLNVGTWSLLLVDPQCQDCVSILHDDERLVIIPNLVVVSVGDVRMTPRLLACSTAVLGNPKDWIVETPLIVRIQDGMIVEVSRIQA